MLSIRAVCLFSGIGALVGPFLEPDLVRAQNGGEEAAAESDGGGVGGGEGPVTSVLKTRVTGEGGEGLAGAVERMIRSRLESIGVVHAEGTPGLGLEDLQLAVGCVSETDQCLKAVAEQLEVEALILSSIDRAGDTILLTITYFDARTGGTDEVTRRASGDGAENTILARVEGALRELFDLPPAPDPEPDEREPAADRAKGGEQTEPASTTEATPQGGTPQTQVETERTSEPAGRHRRRDTLAASAGAETDDLSPVPFVFAGVGLAALLAGTALGFRSQSTEDEYAKSPTDSEAQVDSALSTLDKAERQAMGANILFGVGGALVIGGTVLFFVMNDLPAPSSERAVLRVMPVLAGHAGGVTISGPLGAH